MKGRNYFRGMRSSLLGEYKKVCCEFLTCIKTLLVTGSSGLIGSEVCIYFARELGFKIDGVDNNQRAVFFGPQGDTRWNHFGYYSIKELN